MPYLHLPGAKQLQQKPTFRSALGEQVPACARGGVLTNPWAVGVGSLCAPHSPAGAPTCGHGSPTNYGHISCIYPGVRGYCKTGRVLARLLHLPTKQVRAPHCRRLQWITQTPATPDKAARPRARATRPPVPTASTRAPAPPSLLPAEPPKNVSRRPNRASTPLARRPPMLTL